jgi:hypothetical protein
LRIGIAVPRAKVVSIIGRVLAWAGLACHRRGCRESLPRCVPLRTTPHYHCSRGVGCGGHEVRSPRGPFLVAVCVAVSPAQPPRSHARASSFVASCEWSLAGIPTHAGELPYTQWLTSSDVHHLDRVPFGLQDTHHSVQSSPCGLAFSKLNILSCTARQWCAC